MTKRNRTKQMLKEGKTVLGTMITEYATPEVARVMASAGFDFIFVDTEHSPFSLETVSNIVRAGKAVGLTCLARVPDAQYHLMARMLDAGAQGLMVPRVETRENVEEIVRATKYPPQGQRGYSPRSIVTDYEKSSVKDLIAEQNFRRGVKREHTESNVQRLFRELTKTNKWNNSGLDSFRRKKKCR